MPLLEDALEGGPLTAIGIGAVGLMLGVAFPASRTALAPVLKAATKLFLEAEFEAHSALLEDLVDTTIDRLLNVTETGSQSERYQATKHVLDRFKKRARARAKRHGRTPDDRRLRYRHHYVVLHKRLARRREKATGLQRVALDYAASLADQQLQS
jgi:hypothetical protein